MCCSAISRPSIIACTDGQIGFRDISEVLLEAEDRDRLSAEHT